MIVLSDTTVLILGVIIIPMIFGILMMLFRKAEINFDNELEMKSNIEAMEAKRRYMSIDMKIKK